MLIPKKVGADSMVLFKPISLCSIIDKIISKVVANHLKMVMDICIDEAQGAFVLGSLISGNVLVAYEFMHILKRRRSGKIGSL